MPKTVPPKTASERLDLSFGIFARRGEKYSCYSTDFRQLALSKIKQGQSIYKVAKEMGNSGLTLNQYGIASPWLKENDSLRC